MELTQSHMQKMLVLTPRFPYPAVGGDRIRILHLCKALSRHYELILLSFCESEDEMVYIPDDSIFSVIERVHVSRGRSYLNSLVSVFSRSPIQLAYYRSSYFAERASELSKDACLVLCHLIRTGQYATHLGVPKILEMTDAISMNYKNFIGTRYQWGLRELVYRIEQSRLERYEREMFRQFDDVWLVSERDRDYLKPESDEISHVIPNGVDYNSLPFQLSPANARTIIFIGNMHSLQNEDACHYFIREILPKVRSEVDVRFRVVGNAPKEVIRRFANYSNVEFTGRVERIADGTVDGFCGVCPVRAAAGIQNKVLEYMALGLPCVSSLLGCQGIGAVNGVELMTYRDPSEAAKLIVKLYRDLALRERIALAARSFVERNHSWESIYSEICARANSVVQNSTEALFQ